MHSNNKISLINVRLFGSKISKYKSLYTPLGALSISAYLGTNGYAHNFVDFEHWID